MPKRNASLCQLPLALVLLSASAFAQDNPEQGDTTKTSPPPEHRAEHFPPPPPRDQLRAGETDHDLVVGHFGVGVFGVLQLPSMGCTGTPMDCNPDPNFTLSAPAIGARYWLDSRMALEGALGIGYSSGSTTAEAGAMSVDFDEASFFGLALHAGLPLVFATTRHFAFELVPELNVGFVTGGWDSPDGNSDTSLSGFLLELGARVGAEIQFGFIDIPQLALQGTVGLHMRYEGRNASVGNTDTSNHRFGFGTTVQGEPWDIFTGNIAAIYYF